MNCDIHNILGPIDYMGIYYIFPPMNKNMHSIDEIEVQII